MTDNNSNTAVQTRTELSNEQRVMRLSRARSDSENIEAPLPDETTIKGSISPLFDDSGSLVSADELEASRSPTDVFDEWLANNDKAAYDRYKNAFYSNEFPGKSRTELLKGAVRMAISRAKDENRTLIMPSEDDLSGSALEFITHQQVRRDRVLDDSSDDSGTHMDECPKCGTEDITASTVELQTRAADESGTLITKTSCGCTFRRND